MQSFLSRYASDKGQHWVKKKFSVSPTLSPRCSSPDIPISNPSSRQPHLHRLFPGRPFPPHRPPRLPAPQSCVSQSASHGSWGEGENALSKSNVKNRGGRNALGPNDGDEDDKHSDDADEDSLDLSVVIYDHRLPGFDNGRFEVVSAGLLEVGWFYQNPRNDVGGRNVLASICAEAAETI